MLMLQIGRPRYLLVFTFVDAAEKKFFATHEVAEMLLAAIFL